MRKLLISLLFVLICFLASCGEKDKYVLTEDTYFLVMTNILYYPEQYENATLEFDCFTYQLTDTEGVSYMCGVRKCSSGYGCQCGRDTVIGFILNSSEKLPEPIKQSEDSVEKAWIHVSGNLDSMEAKEIKIYAYSGDEIDYNTVETIRFYTLNVDQFNVIEDYQNLAYYVTK